MTRLITAVVLTGLTFGPAAAQGLRFATDAAAPVDVEAGRVVWQQQAGLADLSNGASIVQGPFSLASETMRLRLAAGGQADRLTATGGVLAVSENGRRAVADRAVYELAADTLVLSGGVTVTQSGDDGATLQGAELTLDMATGRARLRGGTAPSGKKGRARIELKR